MFDLGRSAEIFLRTLNEILYKNTSFGRGRESLGPVLTPVTILWGEGKMLASCRQSVGGG